jgi:hypothetical protein
MTEHFEKDAGTAKRPQKAAQHPATATIVIIKNWPLQSLPLSLEAVEALGRRTSERRPHSEETKAKIATSQRARWQALRKAASLA